MKGHTHWEEKHRPLANHSQKWLNFNQNSKESDLENEWLKITKSDKLIKFQRANHCKSEWKSIKNHFEKWFNSNHFLFKTQKLENH